MDRMNRLRERIGVEGGALDEVSGAVSGVVPWYPSNYFSRLVRLRVFRASEYRCNIVLFQNDGSDPGEETMEFVLVFKQPAQTYADHASPVKGPAMLDAWKLYMDTMASAGVMRGGNRLNALGATTVQLVDGKRQVQDGPHAGTKDLLGGYVVIEVPTLEDALQWAERSPSSALGCTEVWPVLSMSPK